MYAQLKQTVQKPKCLVIEDSVFDQRMIQRMIRGAGVDADVLFASSLEAARRILATHRFSMILCDNNLPDGNGTDFAQTLSNDPGYFDIPIVIVSGWPSPFMWAKAKAAGLPIIDKNDQLQAKLAEFFRRRFGRGTTFGPRPKPKLIN
ncbi:MULTISPECIES: response regulator [unclassified Roseovarius]|uniref:response regulator n=1 Tax=unclassified Roseovarius TaxID=2614913 RepID=UPI00273EE9E0|nr:MULTISPECIES: response regulator [unclassified Roseovarius]